MFEIDVDVEVHTLGERKIKDIETMENYDQEPEEQRTDERTTV